MEVRKTPLHQTHVERGARLTEFGGWEMPVEFSSIRDEHTAVRTGTGIFDVSHMGQVRIAGEDAYELTQCLTTADVASIDIGSAQYTVIPHRDGSIIDDAILYRIDASEYLLIPNAGKDDLVTKRWTDHRDEQGYHATIENQTSEWGMLAVQGQDAEAQIPATVGDLPFLGIRKVSIDGIDCWCARTGYTGEDGFELIIPWDATRNVDAIIEGTRCGLGARDTLRLEMGYVLAGNEFDQEDNRRNPFEARLDFAVDLGSEPPCIAVNALRTEKAEGPGQLLSGIVMQDRGIPRHGYPITDGQGAEIGIVTSGTMSPTLGEPIGLGYVDAKVAEEGRTIGIDVRGTEKMASIVTPPFVEARR